MTPPFRLSLAHASLLHVSPPDLVRVAAATGYEFVGFRLIPIDRPGEPRWTLADEPGALAETRRALADTGVRLLDVEVAQIRADQDPHSYAPALDAAAELGARFVLANIYTPNATAATEGLASLCDLAQPLGLTVAVEFVSFSDLRTLRDAVVLVHKVQRQNACILLDTLHFHSSRAPVSDVTAVPSDLIHYVHLCDGPREVPTAFDDLRRITREERLLPGEGGIDLAGIIRGLPRHVIYAVEALNPTRAKAVGAEPYARLAYDTTMRYLATVAETGSK